MPAIPTVEIHSWKDPDQKWVINAEDFDAEKHVRWGGPYPHQDIHPEAEDVSAAPVDSHTPMRPSVPDYVHDDDGNIVTVNIIDPDRRTSRKEISYGDYDPDHHDLWSSHPRFH